MAEFRQVWLPARNGWRVDPKRIPPPHPQPQAALGEPPPELGRPRHTQLTAGPKCTHSGTSVLAPGATRPRLGNHEGPRTRGCGQPTPTWRRRNPQGWMSPTRPLRRPAVTISQQEPVFLGRHKDTQWHRCQQQQQQQQQQQPATSNGNRNGGNGNQQRQPQRRQRHSATTTATAATGFWSSRSVFK